MVRVTSLLQPKEKVRNKHSGHGTEIADSLSFTWEVIMREMEQL